MPKPTPSEAGLTFDWAKTRGEWLRLMVWLLITLAGLAAFFALFRVVYPQPQRLVPTAQQVTVLGSDPAGRSVLNMVQDRDFLIIPSSEDRKSPVSLEDNAPVFHPSYEKHEMKLLDLPQRDVKPKPARLLDPREPVLPKPDLSALTRAPEPAFPQAGEKLTLRIGGELGARTLVFQPDFLSLQMTDIESWRFHLGVDEAGRVTFALPIDATGKLEEAAPLLKLLRQVRFEAATGKNVVWGEATIGRTAVAGP